MVLAYNTSPLSGLASGVDKIANAYAVKKRNQGLSSGLQQIQSGNWESGIKTIAEQDPEVALGLAQYKQKSDDAIALQQMKNEQANQITPYQQAMIDIQQKRLEKSGEITPYQERYLNYLENKDKQEDNNPFSSQNEFINLLGIRNNAEVWDKLPDDQKSLIDARLNYLSNNPENIYETKYQGQLGKRTADIETTGDIEQQKQQAKLLSGDIDAYQNMISKMPELEQTVDVLSNLGKKATYTKAGQIYDIAMREGLGLSTEGSVARAEYEAVVNNQILPLLRDTFGAQFTEREGESLRRTLGDVNKTPEEKDAVLRSFIEQKVKSIESLGRKIESYDKPIKQTPIKQEENLDPLGIL